MYLNMLQFCRQSLRVEEDICEEEDAVDMSEESETESVTDGSSTDQENVADEVVNTGMGIFDNVDKPTKLSQQEFGTLFYRTETTLKKRWLRKLRVYYETIYGHEQITASEFHKLDWGAYWNKVKLKNGDTITSAAAMQKHDKVRANCFIRYSLIDSDGITQQYIGKVHIFFEHSFQNKIHFTAMVQHCPKVEDQVVRYKYQVVRVEQDAFSKDGDLVPPRIEFVDIGAIDCLVGLMGVRSDQTVEWWVVDRTHGKGGTYDTVIGEIVGG